MENASFDLEGLVKWGVNKALDHGQTLTGLPIGELSSHAMGFVETLGIPTIEIDPLMLTLGKLVLAGLQKQQAIAKLKQGDSNDSP